MNEKLTFEQAYKQLEEIINKMEKGDVSLSESMKLYEQAYKLIIYCTSILEESKGQMIDINNRIEMMKNKESSLFED